MRQLIMLLAALIFGGCAGYTTQIGPCSKYPCEWSRPVIRRPTPPPPDYSEAAKMYLCLEPTRAYPLMPLNTCI
jgi:hypothetical protein